MKRLSPLACARRLLTLGTAPAAAPAQPAYQTGAWSPAFKLIWANSGISGEFAAPGNWKTETGQPATAAPDWDANIVLTTS